MKKTHDKLILRQYLFETEGWDRLLVYFQKEITAFKTRLSEITEMTDGKALATVEKFQDEFLAQDKMLQFLSSELKKQLILLSKDPGSDDHPLDEVTINQNRIRNDFKKAGVIFSKLKGGFSGYLAKLF
jgi:hypothetical protein